MNTQKAEVRKRTPGVAARALRQTREATAIREEDFQETI